MVWAVHNAPGVERMLAFLKLRLDGCLGVVTAFSVRNSLRSWSIQTADLTTRHCFKMLSHSSGAEAKLRGPYLDQQVQVVHLEVLACRSGSPAPQRLQIHGPTLKCMHGRSCKNFAAAMSCSEDCWNPLEHMERPLIVLRGSVAILNAHLQISCTDVAAVLHADVIKTIPK